MSLPQSLGKTRERELEPTSLQLRFERIGSCNGEAATANALDQHAGGGEEARSADALLNLPERAPSFVCGNE
jgi:hypothetical protein